MAEPLRAIHLPTDRKGSSGSLFYARVCHILRIAAYIKTIVNRNKADEMSGI